MIMPKIPDLDELDPAAEMVDHLLKPAEMPPFDGVIELASRHHEPIGNIQPHLFGHARGLSPFLRRQMNVPAKGGRPDLASQLFVDVLDESPEKMSRQAVGLMNEWVMAIDGADAFVPFVQAREVRIVFPKVRTGCAHIGAKTPGMTLMQIADRGGQHQNVTRRLTVFEDQFLHSLARNPAGSGIFRQIEDELATSVRPRSSPACASENNTSTVNPSR